MHRPLIEPVAWSSATEVPDKEDNSTTKKDLDYTMTCNQDPNVTSADVIRIFAGDKAGRF